MRNTKAPNTFLKIPLTNSNHNFSHLLQLVILFSFLVYMFNYAQTTHFLLTFHLYIYIFLLTLISLLEGTEFLIHQMIKIELEVFDMLGLWRIKMRLFKRKQFTLFICCFIFILFVIFSTNGSGQEVIDLISPR